MEVKHLREDGGRLSSHHAQRQHNVEQRHKGHQLLADAADALDAAQQHQRHQHGHHDAHDEVEGGQIAVQPTSRYASRAVVNGGDDGVHLRGVAGAEDGQHAEQGVKDGQKLPAAGQGRF